NLTDTDKALQSQARSDTQATLSALRIEELQSQIEPLAKSLASSLAEDRPVDLISEFAEPWCAAVAFLVTGSGGKDRDRLLALARRVSAATADPDNPDLKAASAAANGEIERSINGTIPMAGAAFVALTQTLPAFLAKAWLALLRYPDELFRL